MRRFHVYTAGLKGCLVWPSFYRAAGFVVRESATKPVHQARWTDPIAVRAQFSATTAAKQGVKAPAGTPVAPGLCVRNNPYFGAVVEERRAGPVRTKRPEWPDRLSDWTLPPPGARAVGEVEPVRVFDSAEAAMAFLEKARLFA